MAERKQHPMPDPTTAEPPEEWGIVEMFGHICRAGRISEVERFGATMMRLDIPDADGGGFRATQFIGGGALFRVTPTDEATARRAARSLAAPVHRYELPVAEPGWDGGDDQVDDEPPWVGDDDD